MRVRIRRFRLRMTKLTIISLGAVSAVIVAGYIWMCRPHAEITTAPLTASEAKARFGLAGLPAAAHDVYFARSSGGLGGRAQMLRFSAPIADCKAFASSYSRPYLPAGQTAEVWVPLTQPPDPPDLRAYGLAVEWFDIGSMREGVALSRPVATCPSIWIDMSTETFYSYWTD